LLLELPRFVLINFFLTWDSSLVVFSQFPAATEKGTKGNNTKDTERPNAEQYTRL
jgi:hypothetical protein